MTESPLVYIIVLTWNGRTDTLECLRSLQRLRYSNARTLIVDNASTDGTPEAIRREFPGVEVAANRSNLRFAGGNNIGIKRAIEAGADYILLLNNDTTVDPDFLPYLVHAVEGNENAGMAGPKILYYSDPHRLWFAGGKIEWWKGWVSHVGIREIDRGQYDEMREVDYLTGCCLLVRREIIEKIGMLDESYYIYGEDADWCIRATRAGYKLLYVPSARIWHKVSVSTGGHLSWYKNWNKLKSQLRLMARYAKPYHWLTIPLWIVVNVARGYKQVKQAGR
jgi:GT2 family glycosyltransferase